MNAGLTDWLRRHLFHISVLLTLAVAAQCLLIGTGVVHPRRGSMPQAASMAATQVGTPAPTTPHQPNSLLLKALRGLGQIGGAPISRTVIAVDPKDTTTEVQIIADVYVVIEPAELTKKDITMRSATEATVSMPQLTMTIGNLQQQYRLISDPQWLPISAKTPSETAQFTQQQLNQLAGDATTECSAAYHATLVMQAQARNAGVPSLDVVFPGLKC